MKAFDLARRGLIVSLATASGSGAVRVAAEQAQARAVGEGWFSAFGLKIRVEVSTSSTNGVMSATRVISPPGGGPPAHSHTREDEVFLIVRGRYRFWQKGMPTIDASAGSLVRQHKGMIHQYRNVSNEEGEHIVICLPGGLEELFAIVASEQLIVPRDMQRVIALSADYGIKYESSIAD